MTTAATDAPTEIPKFYSPAPASPPLEFELDDESYTLLPLKLTSMVAMLRLLESDRERSIIETGSDTAQLLMSLMGYITDGPVEVRGEGDTATVHLHGRARLYQRLGDPEDTFDLPALLQVFRYVGTRMFPDRPTGASPESGTERRDTDSAPSAAATPSKPAKTSGQKPRKSPSRSPKSG